MAIILESLRMSPSSFGLEWWKFVIVENISKREELLQYAYWQRQVVDASHLLVLCRTTGDATDLGMNLLNRTAQTRNIPMEALDGYKGMLLWTLGGMDNDTYSNFLSRQVYIALWFAMSTCALMSVDSCAMEWFDKAKFDEILWLDQMWLASCVLLPIGYRSAEDSSSKYAKVRKSTEEVVIKI